MVRTQLLTACAVLALSIGSASAQAVSTDQQRAQAAARRGRIDHRHPGHGAVPPVSFLRERSMFAGRKSSQITRSPRLQTPRTSGMSPVSRTRTRSARRPVAMRPRSSSPTRAAGVAVTVRTARGKS